MKFRLLAGTHATGGGKDKDGNDIPTKLYAVGDIVESNTDLVKAFNTRTSRKFERVSDDAVAEPVHEAPTDTYDDMTVEQLRSFAADNEVDLGRARSKAEIIRVLRMLPA